jgi:hypothetical protein
MLTLFFSYAHRDEELRNELEVHLAMLKRQGIIATWHDRRIIAGEPVDPVISEQLEEADIVLLLVSPYFLASDYCYDIEMQRALEKHEAGTTHVIPVILRPCDWQHALFGKLRATPPDGKPISTFANQHEAFLAVTKDIRKAAEELRNRAGPQSPIRLPTREVQQPITVKPDMRSSNLRLKKPFSDHERDQFLDEAFEYIARFFEGSLLELGKRNAWIEGQFKRIDTNHFTAAVYANGTVATRCKIWLGGRDMLDGILYSTNDLGSDTSVNESLRVEDDGYSLFLKPLMAFQHRPATDQLTMQGAAEYYWSKFIERLQN